MPVKKLTALNAERRLRPIYEQLDAGVPKKALTEIERLLKKAPNCFHISFVKALALVRSGREDEARAIIQHVANSRETSELVSGDSLQILTMCCKELGEPDIICKILETRVAKEKTEVSVVHYFMSLVRVSAYRKMHHIALSMYKNFHNPTYFSWAIASLILPYDLPIGPLPYNTMLSLQLAERMTEKFIAEERAKNGQLNALVFGPLLNMYVVLLLRLSSNYSKILDVFHAKGYLPQNISTWQWNIDHENYCDVMVRAERKSELFLYLRNLFMKHNDFALLKQIVDIFGQDRTTVDQTIEFMNDLRVNHGSFVVALGNLYFATQKLNGYCPNTDMGKVKDDLKMVIEFGSGKTNFYPDAVTHFKMVDLETQVTLIESMRPPLETDDNVSMDLSMPIGDILKNINYEIARREVLGKSMDSFSRKKVTNTCCNKYLCLLKDYKLRFPESTEPDASYVKPKKLEDDEKENEIISAKETANKYMNQYMLLASSYLFSGYENSVRTVFLESSEIELKDNKVQRCDEQFLVAAICALEYCFAETLSSIDHTVRLVLGNAYSRLGVSRLMWTIMNPIEIKQIQWDSIGYLVIPILLTTGSYEEAYTILNQAHSVYSSFESETADMVIVAYDHCNFEQAAEFLVFRDQLLQSTQCGLVLTEKLLLEFMTDITSLEHLQYHADKVLQQLDLESMLKIACHDNRDLTLLQNVVEEAAEYHEIKESTAKLDKLWFQQRLSFLTILTKLSQMSSTGITKVKKAGVNEMKGNILTDDVTCLEKAIQFYKKFSEAWVASQEDIPKGIGILYFEIYPSQYSRHFQLSLPWYLLEQLECVMKLVKEEKADCEGLNHLKNLQVTFGQQAIKLLNILKENLATFQKDPCDIRVLQHIQEFHFILEFFAFSKIIFAVGVMVTKRLLLEGSQGNSKGKRRKTVHQVMMVVKENVVHFQNLTEIICQFINFLKNLPLATWPDPNFTSEVFRQSPEIKYILDIFPSTYDSVRRKIRESHLSQLGGMSDISELMMHFVRDMN